VAQLGRIKLSVFLLEAVVGYFNGLFHCLEKRFFMMITSFLAQNLQALNPCPEHEKLKQLLQDYETTRVTTPIYDLQETQTGDLTLWQGGIAIHSLTGAVAEAEGLVKEQLLTSQHAINCLLGLGLGYTLKAAVEQYQKRGFRDSTHLVCYEPDIAQLHFVLSNINLSAYLSHAAFTLLPTPEAFYQFVESHLVSGDGISFIATPGYLQANSVVLNPVIEKLSKHAVNTLRNADLLSARGKLWATQFLQNLPALVTVLPINALQNSLSGRVGILCGAGPSLLDEIETLKAQRENVVIFAVTGAVAPLLKAGIVPDFVMFMDFVGPSKHLKDVPKDALKTAHFIMGPSAEGCLFDWEHQASWLGALHFNEQFSYILDKMYGLALPRYHTGGTVSIFMFQVAFDLGIRDFILLGQDMAFRGNQVYADGTAVTLTTTTASLPETEHTVARCMELEVVKGWQGEDLLTQSDYAHFLYHYTRMPHLVAKEGHTVGLYNASVGGAFIEGWEHATLAQLFSQQVGTLLKPAGVNKALANVQKQLQKQLPLALMRNRLFSILNSEEKSVERLITTGGLALQYLQQLMKLPTTQWEKVSGIYSRGFNLFSAQLEEHPFLKDTFYGEQLKIYQAYNKQAISEAEHRANMDIDERYLSNLLTQLETGILQPLVATQKALLAQGTIEPVAVETLTVKVNKKKTTSIVKLGAVKKS
jgi:hypothetical protein